MQNNIVIAMRIIFGCLCRCNTFWAASWSRDLFQQQGSSTCKNWVRTRM